jgi:hypothetical protein
MGLSVRMQNQEVAKSENQMRPHRFEKNTSVSSIYDGIIDVRTIFGRQDENRCGTCRVEATQGRKGDFMR